MTRNDDFKLIREEKIEEYKTLAKIYQHKKTGARILFMENDDENKVFGITFRTPPKDSTGIAHIMEHSVLCGSRKYPVKEPFVELIKGSLSTFLNAFTYPDKTCYPVASQNLQDFYNLVDVYLDAVFYPRITPFTLQQEGWHYELEDVNGPISYKGVVFNEMKGNYSSPDRLIGEYAQQSLFPDTTYGVDSGGHPQHIPDLTWEQFERFHREFYHPSNAFIFFYGDDPAEQRFDILRAYLNDFDRHAVRSQVELQKPLQEPKRLVRKYAVGEDAEAQKYYVTLNWLLPDPLETQRTYSLAILNHILIGTPASPLRKALIDSGLGEDITGGGLEDELRQMFYSTGLKGVARENVDKVERLVLETLEKLAREGIDPQTIEASMNTVEFRLRENNTGSFPRGLSLMLRALTTWLHDADPLAPLKFEKQLAAIKQELTGGKRYFEALIERHFLQNHSRVTLILEPDPELAQKEADAEHARLEKMRAQMSEDDLKSMLETAQTLKKLQETPDPPEALATIPTLRSEDLDRYNKTIPIDVLEKGPVKILYHDLFTNGIAYLDVGFNLRTLPQELLPYLPLFSDALLEMGTEKEDFVRLSQRIGSKTGGIWTRTLLATTADGSSTSTWLFLRSKALMHQVDDLLSILRDVLLTVRLDNRERYRQMLLEEKAAEEAHMIPGGHSVVATRLKALFSEAGWLQEQMGGVNYLFFLRQLIHQVETDWPTVLKKLEEIRRRLVSRNTLLCNVTLDAKNWQTFAPRLHEFIEALPAEAPAFAEWHPEFGEGFEGLTIPAKVNYVGKAANIYDFGYKLHGSTLVINNFLRTTWLWDRVRVQGGAYGGFSSFDRRSGVFGFGSYRDPNLLQTIENYDRSGQFLREVDLNEAEIRKSIIGTIADFDAYRLPDAKGYTSMVRYLIGDSDALLQQLRDEVLSTQVSHFRAFAEVLDYVREKGKVVVLGSREAIEEANKQRGNWLKQIKVL